MKTRVLFGAAALSLACGGGAIAQEPVIVPKLFVWGEAPANWPADDMLARVVQLDLYYNNWLQGVGYVDLRNEVNGPENAALLTAKRIAEGTYAPPGNPGVLLHGPMPTGKIAVILKGFGDESAAFDPPLPGQPDHQQDSYRWFRPNLMTAAESGDRLFTPEEETDGRFVIAFGDINAARSYFSYKHPLVINSGLVPNGTGGFIAAPMRVWMQRFCDRYKAIQASPATYGFAVAPPTPERYSYDSEPITAVPPGPNCVRMLEFLSVSPRWTNMLLPGDPLGRSAAQAYADMAFQHGWNANITVELNGNRLAFERNNLDPNSPDYYDNRNVMAWWFQVVRASQNAIMRHCAYEVLESAWPGVVKYGNYDDLGTDGQPARTGWMQNPPPLKVWNQNTGQCGDWGFLGTPVGMFNQVNIATQFSGSFWETDSPGGNWLSFPTVNDGTYDQPRLYEVGDEGLCAYGLAGLRQFNQYRMGHPEETTWETGLRIDRMLAESTINSFGGGPERTKRLVPWMTTPLYAAGDQNEENYITKPECRELLAMLRAKRIHEGMWWLDKRPGVDATQDEQWQKIWDATQDCSHRVYATRVSKYQRTFEPFPAPPHPPYNVNRLEYTRKDDEVFNGTPRRAEVDVKGRLVVTTGEEPLYKTELVVDFEYQDLWAIAHDHVESYLEAHVEHRSSALGTRTIVYLYDWEPPAGQSNWKQISPNEYADPATGLGVYLCHTSQIDGHWEDRRTFSTDATASFIAPRWAHMDPVDGKYKSKLKLIQFNSVPFWSYYDLVQLIPAWDYVAGPNQSTAAVYQSQSDVNLDGVSNVADVNLYIDNWISADPAADLDLNESVDTTDLDTFVEAYLTGG